MKMGIMDNRQVCITAETKDELLASVVLAMGSHEGVAFGEHDDGLVIFWFESRTDPGCKNPERTRLPYKHTVAQVGEMVWNWLEANRGKRRGDYGDDDVSNCDAFRLSQNSWGHAHDPDSDASWNSGSFFVRPVAGWIGK